MPTATITYERLTTMNAWQAAAIERALEIALVTGAIHLEHGQKTLDEFRRFSEPGSVIRFEKHKG